jgi:type II secretory pathway pseudopilin PulG
MNVKKLTKKDKEIKGSFLLELLLAFAIISIAMTVIVDSFMMSQRSSYTTSEEAMLIKSVSMVFEDMPREARVSNDYSCGATIFSPCSSSNEFYMTHIEGLNGHSAGEDISYKLSSGKIQKNIFDGNGYLDMVPPNVVIDSFNVRVVGSLPDTPERALVTLSAHSKNDSNIKINMQTSFTVRIY